MPTLSLDAPGGPPLPAGPLTPDTPTLPQLHGEDGRLLIEVAESVARRWREYRDRGLARPNHAPIPSRRRNVRPPSA
jgi:hypothetical protein